MAFKQIYRRDTACPRCACRAPEVGRHAARNEGPWDLKIPAPKDTMASLKTWCVSPNGPLMPGISQWTLL